MRAWEYICVCAMTASIAGTQPHLFAIHHYFLLKKFPNPLDKAAELGYNKYRKARLHLYDGVPALSELKTKPL